jgi:uncharacterized protein YjbI with pentapeptide repeats
MDPSQHLNHGGATLVGTDFSGKVLDGADFRNARLVRVRFCNATLLAADFRGAQLELCDFGGAQLLAVADKEIRIGNRRRSLASRIGWQGRKSFKPNGRHCRLDFVKATKTSFRETDFGTSTWTLTNFDTCDLRGSSWIGRGHDPRLFACDIGSADLSGAVVDGWSEISCRTDGKTQRPTGADRGKWWRLRVALLTGGSLCVAYAATAYPAQTSAAGMAASVVYIIFFPLAKRAWARYRDWQRNRLAARMMER